MALKFDPSLYLVTDSARAAGGRTLPETVAAAIEGGVTMVQLREKTAATRDFVALARAVKRVARKGKAALVINERVDVARAVDADGVHLGQTDMPLDEARRLMGPDKIIGVSVRTAAEAEAALLGGADYLSIGPCYSEDESALGSTGVLAVWEHALQTKDPLRPPCAVTFGGIDQYNAPHVLHATTPGALRPLDGLAVVSAIMAAPSAREAARSLRRQIRFAREESWTVQPPAELTTTGDMADVRQAVADAFAAVRKASEPPQVHHVTSSVAACDCASACLALGGQPTISGAACEQPELAAAASALVVSTGAGQTDDVLREALRHAARHRKPVVLDVDSATPYRTGLARELLRDYNIYAIRASAAGIAALVSAPGAQPSNSDPVFSDPVGVICQLSRRCGCLVIMTGAVGYLSDGSATFAIRNGHRLQDTHAAAASISATALATHIYTPSSQAAPLVGALAGAIAINIAAEHAAARSDVKGPGTFRPAFIDEMYSLTSEMLLEEMKIERME
ncbi:thiamine biosynthetic bifunctional enzyme [Coemansia sp. RSA 552]|nr:thiamine biosynthetic bifunctional enzyme [Coemansia sp. RSA 552]